MHMLASLTSKDGNTPLIDGFFDNKEPPTAEEVEQMKRQAANMNLEEMARNLGVARYKWDDPYMVLKGGRFETSFNLDGIWGGNMYAGGAGAIMPNKITSKHNFRYVPRMNGLDIVKKLRAQLDKNGYKDVELKLIGDVPWSRGSAPDTDISVARRKAAEQLEAAGFTSGPPPGTTASAADDYGSATTGGYWPAYVFADGENGEKVGTVSIPMGQGGAGGFIGGGGGRSHASNEYYTIEAIGKTGGMAHQEKGVVAALYEFSKTTTVPPKPKTSAAK
jgi:acetylornithine deacetylase/succinyl-diaminopimelate desuccinylase-like protein